MRSKILSKLMFARPSKSDIRSTTFLGFRTDFSYFRKPMLMVGLLACATSCGGLNCAVAADKIKVPDVDLYVEKSIMFLSRTSEYIIT